jgi:dTMP kinase
MRKNKYIAFEGLDASGKSTQSKTLVEKLEARGEKVVWTREPGSPLIDLNLRDIILSHKKLAPQTLELLLQADRAEHTTKVKELLADGYWVISDRSAISGLVYSTSCGSNTYQIKNIMSYSIQVYPDLVFFLDITVEEAERRRLARNEAATREEVKGNEFKNKLRDGFKYLAAQALGGKVGGDAIRNTNGERVPIVEIDGKLPAEDITAMIERALELL